jgi:MOSC domain-containing protein YiiM
MRIVSVNVGMPREVAWKGMTVRTSIFKEPVGCPVMDRQTESRRGDSQADLTVHCGEEKSVSVSVYAYPAEHYEFWRHELPEVSFSWGIFGENTGRCVL